MMSAEEIANLTFNKLKDNPPSANKQAKMLYGAMKAYMKNNIHMDVEQINKKFVKLTGALKDENNITAPGVVGRFGEVVVGEGVNSYFQIDSIRKRYGAYVVSGMANVMIPADSNKAQQTKDGLKRELTGLARQAQKIAFRQWKKLFPSHKSVPDFFMQNAHPLEVKTKINSYIFVSQNSGTETHQPASRTQLTAENKFLKGVQEKGGKILVGGVWADTVWKDVTEELEPLRGFSKSVMKMLEKKAIRIGHERGGVTLKYDWTLPKGQGRGGEGRLFELISVRLTAFIPMVADEKNLIKVIEHGYITRSDMGALEASSKFTANLLKEVLIAHLNSMKK